MKIQFEKSKPENTNRKNANRKNTKQMIQFGQQKSEHIDQKLQIREMEKPSRKNTSREMEIGTYRSETTNEGKWKNQIGKYKSKIQT